MIKDWLFSLLQSLIRFVVGVSSRYRVIRIMTPRKLLSPFQTVPGDIC